MRTATAVDVSDMKSSCCDDFASSSCISTPSSSCCVVDKSLNDSIMVIGGENESNIASTSIPIYENVLMISQNSSSNIDNVNESTTSTTIKNEMSSNECDDNDLRKEIEDEILKKFLCNDDDDDDDALTSSKYSKDDDVVSSHNDKCEMQPQLLLVHDDKTTSATVTVAASANVDENVVDFGGVLLKKNSKISNSKNIRKTVRKNFSLWIGVTSCVWGLLLLFVKNYYVN
jgi:hypothetical protein